MGGPKIVHWDRPNILNFFNIITCLQTLNLISHDSLLRDKMSTGMYTLNPVYSLSPWIDLPTCMYSLPGIQVSKLTDSVSKGWADVSPQVLQSLAARQEEILVKLNHLRAQVLKYTKSDEINAQVTSIVQQKVSVDVVVRCSPSHPPFALLGLISQLTTTMNVFTSMHCHSSVSKLPAHLSSFLPPPQVERGQANLKITLIWKEVGRDCELMVSPISQSLIQGEVNLIRFFARIFPTIFSYETSTSTAIIDSLLDNVTSLLWSSPKNRQPRLRPLADRLCKTSYLSGDTLGIADLALFSTIKQLRLDKDLPPELRKWFTSTLSHLMGGKSRRKSRPSSTRKSFHKRKNSERKGPGNEETPQSSAKMINENKEPKFILKSSGSLVPIVTVPLEAETKEIRKKEGMNLSGKENKELKGNNKNNVTTIKIGGGRKPTKKKTSPPTDKATNSAPGSLFTNQWPEIKHIFQSSSFTSLLGQRPFVSEKLDGSNLALSSRGVISSRRTVLLNRPDSYTLLNYKFSGVKLNQVYSLLPNLEQLENRFSSMYPMLTVQCLVYGELIQQGTATNKEDIYGYKKKGLKAGKLQVFGCGVVFDEKLDDIQISRAKKTLTNLGFNVMVQENLETKQKYLIILFNEKLREMLLSVGITSIVEQKQLSFENAIEDYTNLLIQNSMEGIVLVFNQGIFKWKGVEESYPDLFVNQINDLYKILRFMSPDALKVVDKFIKVAQEAKAVRLKSKHDPDNSKFNPNLVSADLLKQLQTAYKSAVSKYRLLDEELKQKKLNRSQILADYSEKMMIEMLKDSNENQEFIKYTLPYIKYRITLTQ